MAERYFEFFYNDGEYTSIYVGSMPEPQLQALLRGELSGWVQVNNIGWMDEEFGEAKVVFLEESPAGTSPEAFFRADGFRRISLIQPDATQWLRGQEPTWE